MFPLEGSLRFYSRSRIGFKFSFYSLLPSVPLRGRYDSIKHTYTFLGFFVTPSGEVFRHRMWGKFVRWFPGRRGGQFVRLCPSSCFFSCGGCQHDFWLMFNILEEPLLTWNSPVPDETKKKRGAAGRKVAAALHLTQARIIISCFHLMNSQHVSFSVFLDAIIRLSLVSAHLHLLLYTQHV